MKRILFIISIIIFVSLVVYSGNIVENIVNSLKIMLVILIVSPISCFVHELGHYIAAKSFKQTPGYFIGGTTVFGMKKMNGIITFKLFGTHFIINPMMHAGSVEAHTYINKITPHQVAAIAISGPIANLIFATIIFLMNYSIILKSFEKDFTYFISSGTPDAIFLNVVLIVIGTNLIYFVTNLIPLEGTDGWFFAKALKNKKTKESFILEEQMHKSIEMGLAGEYLGNKIIAPLYEKK